ncbi:MAG: HAD family hydrolase [Gammaproteobacteria bacterium]|nr:HAD family hydrolase [Gammaproteobacteria bacterium]
MLFRERRGASRRCAKVDTLVVDKTGTLDRGPARAGRASHALGGMDEDEVLRLAASLERGSEHPLAAAIVRAAEERGPAAGRRRRTSSPITGKGVTGPGRRARRGARQSPR